MEKNLEKIASDKYIEKDINNFLINRERLGLYLGAVAGFAAGIYFGLPGNLAIDTLTSNDMYGSLGFGLGGAGALGIYGANLSREIGLTGVYEKFVKKDSEKREKVFKYTEFKKDLMIVDDF